MINYTLALSNKSKHFSFSVFLNHTQNFSNINIRLIGTYTQVLSFKLLIFHLQFLLNTLLIKENIFPLYQVLILIIESSLRFSQFIMIIWDHITCYIILFNNYIVRKTKYQLLVFIILHTRYF